MSKYGGMRSYGVRSLFLALLSMLLVPIGVAGQTTTSPELDSLLAQDSKTTCDGIGWSFADNDFLTQHDLLEIESMLSCVVNRGTLAACGTIQGEGSFLGPPSGQQWIACFIIVANAGGSSFEVSMFDFALVDASGQKYTYDLNAQASMPTQMMLPTTTLRAGQRIQGTVAFAVPKSVKLPLVLESDPLVSFSLDDEVGRVVIPTLVPMPNNLDG